MPDQTPLCAPSVCTHPPAHLFTWYAYDDTLCIACCDCGEVLAGAAEPWHQLADDDGHPISSADLIFEAVTTDGHILGSSYLNGYGPRAYVMDANRDGWDTIAFNGHDKFDIVANGKPKAVKLLQELIAYERRPSRD